MIKRTPNRFERLVMPHLDSAYNLARWLVEDRDDAEDAVQEAMTRACKYLDSCRDDTARQWVLRIVRNTCYDWLAAKRSMETSGFADIDADDPNGEEFSHDVFQPGVPTPEDILVREDLRGHVQRMIATLPPHLREVVVLRELDDLSYKEIAEITGTPVGTVMSRLSRARSAMIKQWNADHGRK